MGVLSENTHPDPRSGQKEPPPAFQAGSIQANRGCSGLVVIVKPRQLEQLWISTKLGQSPPTTWGQISGVPEGPGSRVSRCLEGLRNILPLSH